MHRLAYFISYDSYIKLKRFSHGLCYAADGMVLFTLTASPHQPNKLLSIRDRGKGTNVTAPPAVEVDMAGEIVACLCQDLYAFYYNHLYIICVDEYP